MSRPIHLARGAVVCSTLLALAVPGVAHAATVNLGSANAFVVLAGAAATNTGSSVLYGDLGVSPGTSVFGAPAVVNGNTHAADSVAAQAQTDLTAAYNVAAQELPETDLTGQNLGGLTLPAGAYAYSTSAQLTGTLTLDGGGDPNAQFVIKVGSQLTTASNSVVALQNGASACNVYWKVDTATLGTTTAFAGNLMALTSITLNNGSTVQGRVLAQNGAVTLDNNVLDASGCGANTTRSAPPLTGAPSAPTPTGAVVRPPTAPVARRAPSRRGRATLRRSPRKATPRGRTPQPACNDGFRGTVTGRMIKRVTFRLDGKVVASRTRSPFGVSVRAAAGSHKVTARVTFKDATRARTLTMPYRACAAATLQPRRGPSQFTG